MASVSDTGISSINIVIRSLMEKDKDLYANTIAFRSYLACVYP